MEQLNPRSWRWMGDLRMAVDTAPPAAPAIVDLADVVPQRSVRNAGNSLAPFVGKRLALTGINVETDADGNQVVTPKTTGTVQAMGDDGQLVGEPFQTRVGVRIGSLVLDALAAGNQGPFGLYVVQKGKRGTPALSVKPGEVVPAEPESNGMAK